MGSEAMVHRPPKGNYFDDIKRRNGLAWCGSALVAAGFNLMLFMLMPSLMRSDAPRPLTETLVPQVNVIRVRQAKPEVARKTVKPPEPTEAKPVQHPKTVQSRPVKLPLHLPFEINPRLPGGPSSLELPPLESAPMTAAGDLAGVFSVGELDAPLTPLTCLSPLYPMRAKDRGIEGWVKVKFLVDADGRVGEVSILNAHPEGLFEKSVRRCIGGWRFKPGTVAGMAVKTWVETTIRFELE
jgi:periplasmic protein TonB